MRTCFLLAAVVIVSSSVTVDAAGAQPEPQATTSPTTRPGSRGPTSQPRRIQHLSEIRMRDVNILPDPATRTYYMVGPARNGVRIYTSKDLVSWDGPQVVYQTQPGTWGDIPIVGIWAPEMHKYRDGYYLFLTFDTRTKFAEQWREWEPRVVRGSAVLHADSPLGPFKPFEAHSTPPPDMMTLDGTLWVEDGIPYMIYCHEWVQITNGTLEYIPLKDDLSAATGEPKLMFHATEAPWSLTGKKRGNNVTDGPSLHRSTSGKLFMIWSSGGAGGYTTGLAISDSGKLVGPWRQEKDALYHNDGGHGTLFTTFDGKLMMILHSPNNSPGQIRPRLFELQDTGETLKIKSEFTGH